MAVKAVIRISGPANLSRGTKASDGDTVIVHSNTGGSENRETVSQTGHAQKQEG